MKLLNSKLSDIAVRELALDLIVEGLPFRSLKERHLLPNVPAIYFVVDHGQVTYVGETGNLKQRRFSPSATGHTESSVTHWLEVEGGIKGKKLRCHIERVLICRFRPSLNAQYKCIPLEFAHLSGERAYMRAGIPRRGQGWLTLRETDL